MLDGGSKREDPITGSAQVIRVLRACLLFRVLHHGMIGRVCEGQGAHDGLCGPSPAWPADDSYDNTASGCTCHARRFRLQWDPQVVRHA